jgi:VIT1/CCC1 family predicted Fe2+/Mn2+ transporter
MVGVCVAGAVLVLGFANLIADGISMGYGDFLSSTAERDFAANEQQVADWLMEHELHEEMLDLVSAYEDRGMEKQDADKVSFLRNTNTHLFSEAS